MQHFSGSKNLRAFSSQPAPGPPVKIEYGNAVRVAAFLIVNFVPVADRKITRIIRLNRRKKLLNGLSFHCALLLGIELSNYIIPCSKCFVNFLYDATHFWIPRV